MNRPFQDCHTQQTPTMPSVESKKSKGKGKAVPAEAKATASLPLGKQLAHTGMFQQRR
jgi:hypothetical protein